jgi:hypothetical protein
MEKYYSGEKILSRDANTILKQLTSRLATFKKFDDRDGADPNWDVRFAAEVTQAAKELADLEGKDPLFVEGPQNGHYNGLMTITLFRGSGPVVYKFVEQPIIAHRKAGFAHVTWYMRAQTGICDPRSQEITLTNREAALLWTHVYENRH